MPNSDELVAVGLTHAEREMLCDGLTDWGGPVLATPAMATQMGFASLRDLRVEGDRISVAIARGHPLSVEDWSRALRAIELLYVEEAFEWGTIRGGSSEYWDDLLRRLREKLAKFK